MCLRVADERTRCQIAFIENALDNSVGRADQPRRIVSNVVLELSRMLTFSTRRVAHHFMRFQ